MSSFNKVILMGNLTRDPEVRSTPSGQSVTAFGIASNRTYTVGGPGGEKKEEVTFVDVDFWGRRGEVVAQYLKKGDPIFVEGRLTYRQWEDKDGNKRNKLSVTAENFEFIGGRGGGERQGGGGGARGHGEDTVSAGGDDQGFDEVHI